MNTIFGSTDTATLLWVPHTFSPPTNHCTLLPQWGVEVGGVGLLLLHSLPPCLLLAALQGAPRRMACPTATSKDTAVEASSCTSSDMLPHQHIHRIAGLGWHSIAKGHTLPGPWRSCLAACLCAHQRHLPMGLKSVRRHTYLLYLLGV